MAYQESELLTLLKKIPLGPAELTALRERAEQLKEGTIKTRGDALLPIFLASFIFDALCLGGTVYNYWILQLRQLMKIWYKVTINHMCMKLLFTLFPHVAAFVAC